MPAPEVQTVALTFADGTLGVMRFVTRSFEPNGDIEFQRAATDAAITAETIKAFGQSDNAVSTWRRIVRADLPFTRAYRGAWIDSGFNIVHDMNKAREIHRDKLRVDRAPLLAQLDSDYQRADETNDTAEKVRIAKLKKKLRDITDDPRIDQAVTIDDLIAIKIT